MGIESSCDETAAAVVVNGRDVRSNIISSQIDIHTLYGGVVPELASRAHIVDIVEVLRGAFKEAGLKPEDIDGVAVTQGPGLIGSLLVGIEAAKAFAFGARSSPTKPPSGAAQRIMTTARKTDKACLHFFIGFPS